jgi:hypothetical protein
MPVNTAFMGTADAGTDKATKPAHAVPVKMMDLKSLFIERLHLIRPLHAGIKPVNVPQGDLGK